jgi:cobalt-zinc-cadmium efflux system membrane fusion protein
MTPFESPQVSGQIEARTAVPEPLASAPEIHAPPAAPVSAGRRWWYVFLFPLLLVASGVAAYFSGVLERFDLFAEHERPEKASSKEPLAVALVKGRLDTITVPEQVRAALGIKDAAMARVPKKGEPLVMPGSTALDPARIMRVRTRFNAEVVEIGKVTDPARPEGQTVPRERRPGHLVRMGVPWAVLWSILAGGNKSDLVDALVQLRLDERRLEARRKLYRDGYLPE